MSSFNTIKPPILNTELGANHPINQVKDFNKSSKRFWI